jgi:8-oxo-dGTP diphosphatase
MAWTNPRATAIIIKDNKIVLIHRKRNGEEYWAFPGGSIEKDETKEEAVKREVKEETNLDVLETKFAFETVNQDGQKHYVYYCTCNENELKLTGMELDVSSQSTWYNPEWVDINKLSQLTIFPSVIKEKLNL